MVLKVFKPSFVVGRVLRLRRNKHWQQNASFDDLCAGLGHLGKEWIVCGTTARKLPGLTGFSTQAGTGCTDLLLVCSSAADCQALT